jgi:hypothetical protein
MSRLRLRVLIPVTVVLIVGALLGVLQAAAKDNVTPVEGVVFWLSLAALPISRRHIARPGRRWNLAPGKKLSAVARYFRWFLNCSNGWRQLSQ